MKARVRRYALFVLPVALLLLLFGGVYGRKTAPAGDDTPPAAVAGSPALYSAASGPRPATPTKLVATNRPGLSP